MSRDKLIWGGVGVLGVLAFLVYKQGEKDKALGTVNKAASKDLPTLSVPEDIDKVVIVNADKGEVTLEKQAGPALADGGPGDKWVLTKPVSANANQQSAKDLVNNLKDLKVDSEVSLRLDDEVKKDKQLDPAHAVHVIAYKGGEKKLDAFFGKSGTAGQLMMLEGKPDKVYAAKGYSSWMYTKEVKNWRDQEILRFDDANVNQVTVENKFGILSFTKGDKWAATFKGKELERFDEQKVKDMLMSYKMLNAEDFGDGKTKEETGLDKPEAKVTISLKDSAGKFTLSFGKTTSSGAYYVQRDDGGVVYALSKYSAEYATSDKDKYQKPADAGADASKDSGGGAAPGLGAPPGLGGIDTHHLPH